MICRDLIDKKGAESKYVKDCQIRAVLGKPYAEAASLLGWTDPPPIIIRAGIGTLILGENSEDFTPAPTIGQMAKSYAASLLDRSPASQEQVGIRTAICNSCAHWLEGRCTACGCVTSSKIALKSQVCPKGFW